jgi:orotate phosphoribosyltransferase
MIIDDTFARELALDLLKINAVVLHPNAPFTWASGWRSPIYCDNRLTLRYPELRNKIAARFVYFIQQKFTEMDVITGTATAGIPHAAWVAQSLNKPMAYVRAKAKSYGMGNQIEGGVQKGESTVVIEDLISTGGSALSVVEALRFIGADVEGICSIFTYGFDKSVQQLERKSIPLYTLTDYSILIEVAEKHDFIDVQDLKTLANWRKRPERWPN